MITALSQRPDPVSKAEQAEVEGLRSKLAWTRERSVTKALGRVAKLGDQEPLYAAGVALALAGVCLRSRPLFLTGVRIGTAVALSDAMKSVAKRLIKRTRPKASGGDQYRREFGGSNNKDDQSFPSGHMAATVAASRALARSYPGTSGVGTAVVIGLGVTRVVQGEHWPSDVAAGAVIGLLAEAGSSMLAGSVEKALTRD